MQPKLAFCFQEEDFVCSAQTLIKTEQKGKPSRWAPIYDLLAQVRLRKYVYFSK